jgi:hypothetical protein
VFKDVVPVQLIQREEGGVGFRVYKHGLLPHDGCNSGAEIQARVEGMHGVFEGDVAAVSGKETVVGEGVHHRAGATDCFRDRQH